MEKEIWKDIVGYEGMYQVSNMGRVKRLARKATFYHGRVKGNKTINITEKIKKTNISGAGYNYITLRKDRKYKRLTVHRLMAIAFYGINRDKPNVNHRNGIKADNDLSNLEWCTQKENMIHARDNGLIAYAKGEKMGASKLLEKDICEILLFLDLGYSQTRISKIYKVASRTIGSIHLGETWRHISGL